jgi:hypothetical protein
MIHFILSFNKLKNFCKRLHIISIIKYFQEFVGKQYSLIGLKAEIIKSSKNEFMRKTDQSIAMKVYNNNYNLLSRNTGEFLPYIWRKHIIKVLIQQYIKHALS